MTTGPIVADADEREWERWTPDQRGGRGDIEWKTLIGDGATASRALTLGSPACLPAACSDGIAMRRTRSTTWSPEPAW